MNDIEIAKHYLQKEKNARTAGIEFNLPFVSFKNIMKAKRCFYTGLPLTDPRPLKSPRATDRTVDRIDRKKGYEPGNVVASCSSFNAWKGGMENPNAVITIDLMEKAIKKLRKRQKCTL